MSDKFTFAPYSGQGGLPTVYMLDATQLGQAGSLNPGVTRAGNIIPCPGMRRYRVKCIQLTGAGPTRIRALDLAFGGLTATPWVAFVLVAAQVTAQRHVYDFGESCTTPTATGVIVDTVANFMGPYLCVELQNNGADAATYEVELWMQG